jgi:hypothetical protein
VLIGDPAYDDDESLLVNVTNVATGPWIAWFTKVEQQGERASELVAIRRGSNAQDWKVVDGFGVDSGQAGIFDRAHFYDVDIVPVDLKVSDPFLSQQNRWYAMCCETTLSKIAGTIPFGVVSSSGMGDGMYIALAAEGPQGIEGLKLVFLDLEQE